MHIETPLSTALDQYAGLCAVGHLSHLTIEPSLSGPHVSVKLMADAHWGAAEHHLSAWTGKRDGASGPFGAKTSAWLNILGKTLDLQEAFDVSEIPGVPQESIEDVAESIDQLIELLTAASDAFRCVDTNEDFAAVLNELARLSGEAVNTHDLRAARDKAEGQLMWNCTMDLLGGITITEAESPHLSFDVAAVTTDPTTLELARLRVGWAPTRTNAMQYTHSYQVGDDACYAHDDADIDRLMAIVPDDSREHYLHVFDHLHQIAHAAADYADALVGEAIAEASTCDRPLNAIERHDLSHEVHREALVTMNPVAWNLSGEPGLPHHDH